MHRAEDEHRVVVITGASAGLGRAAARMFARKGWRVGLIARGQERLEAAAAELRDAGAEALVLQADVANADAIDRAAAEVMDRWGRIDVWVNNAMATVFAPIAVLSPEEIRRVTEVTYLGQVHGTLSALRHMRPAGRGTIVMVGSALAYRSIPLQAAYCAAKAAVRGFADSLRTELLHEGSPIRLTMVQLPAMNTPQFDWARNRLDRALQPVGTIYDPEAAAAAIISAAESAPRELWVGASSIKAILGTMVAPGMLDRTMARKAWSGQMTERQADPEDSEGNLYGPTSGDPGARGRFGGRSVRNVSAISDTAARATVLMLGFAGVAGLLVGAFKAGSRRRRSF